MCCASTPAEAGHRRRGTLVRAACLAAALLAGSAALAQGSRIHMHGEGLYAADGALFMPGAAANGAGLLLVPDAAGITADVQAAAQSFSAAGYEVVVLDPNRSGPPDPSRTDEDTWADVNAAVAFLTAQSNLQSGQLAVIGIGRGARFALRLAALNRVKAVALEAVSEPSLALESPTPLLASLAGARGKAAPRTSRGAIVTAYPLAPAAGLLFSDADLAAVRRAELQFLQRALGEPKAGAQPRRE